MSLKLILRLVIVCVLLLLFLKTVEGQTSVTTRSYGNRVWKETNETKEDVIPLEIVRNELQTSILEQLLQVYVFSNATNEKCRHASRFYATGLRNFEPWALKMLDASTKLQSGLISGNMMEFGSYTQCVSILQAGPALDINGKHCVLAVLPPEALVKKVLFYRGITNKSYQNVRRVFLNITFEWSICIPHQCRAQDVFTHFEHFVAEGFEGLNVTLQKDILCSTMADVNLPFSTTEKVVFGIIAALCSIVLVSSAVDIYKHRWDKPEGYEIVFSVLANSKWLIAQNKGHQQLACLNGIRVLSILFVIMGHRYLMTVFYASVNTYEFLDWLLNYSSQIVIGGTVSVDSFLLLSGLLLTYHFLLNHHNGHKFNYVLFLLHRYLRLTPSYGFAILVITVFGHRFGMGPTWEQTWRSVHQPCRAHWWSALLYIQSYVNPKEVCFLQSWYLSIDTFYYVLAPVLLVPLTLKRHMTFAVICIVYVASVLVNFRQSFSKEWVVYALLDKQLPTSAFFAEHYTQPHIRASPYIIGIVFGYILYKQRDRKIFLSLRLVFLGWTTSIALLAVVILSNRIFLDPNHVYHALETAIYISLHRSVWVIGLAWIIWACVHGYGGPVNTLLSAHIFSIFGKLTYSAYLIHMQFQYFDNGANKLPNYFSNLSLIRQGFGDIGISFFIGYFLTIFVECPVYRLSLLLFKGRKKVAPKAEPDKLIIHQSRNKTFC